MQLDEGARLGIEGANVVSEDAAEQSLKAKTENIRRRIDERGWGLRTKGRKHRGRTPLVQQRTNYDHAQPTLQRSRAIIAGQFVVPAMGWRKHTITNRRDEVFELGLRQAILG